MADGKNTLPECDPSWFRIAIRANPECDIKDPACIYLRVEKIFTQFCQAGTKFAGAAAYWCDRPLDGGQLRPTDVVVYLLPSANDSLIMKNFPQAKKDPTATGKTAVGFGKNLSEVYLDNPYHEWLELVANTIVHELCHNKLNLGESMHDLASFMGDIGGFLQAELPDNTQLRPSPQDIMYMSRALGRHVPQFDNL